MTQTIASLRPLLLSTIISAFGCGNSTAVDDLAAAIVRGTVVSEGGQPVVGASVSATGFDLTCQGTILATDARIEQPITDGEGSYRLLVQTPLAPREICLAVKVVTAARTDSITMTGSHVHLRNLSDGNLDTAVVNVILPSR